LRLEFEFMVCFFFGLISLFAFSLPGKKMLGSGGPTEGSYLHSRMCGRTSCIAFALAIGTHYDILNKSARTHAALIFSYIASCC